MKFFYTLIICGMLHTPLFGIDTVSFNFHGREKQAEGRFLKMTGIRGPQIFETRDRQFYVVQPADITENKTDNKPFSYYTGKELAAQLTKEFPKSQGYDIISKQHFIVVYSTSKSFANWYGRLMEKLYSQYIQYWNKLDVKVTATEEPLVAVVLSSKKSFLQYAADEGVSLPNNFCAYYNQRTNRVVMYDITGREDTAVADRQRATAKDIDRFLTLPGSYQNVMSVVHEAAHQVGFNCGMHARLSPTPLWVGEGLATFHEVPNEKNPLGWSLGPFINSGRLEIGEVVQNPEKKVIESIVVNDAYFQDEKTADIAYGTAWGLIYYFANERPKELAAYLNIIREKTMTTGDSAKRRLKEFTDCFGSDWEQLYTELDKFYQKEFRKLKKAEKRKK